MFNSYCDKVRDRIYDYVKTNYTKINKDDFELGQIYYNRRCHLNAVQAIHENKASKVFLVVATEKENYKNIIVHFINQESDKYIDNTWGWTHKKWNYYIVREIDESEFDNIDIVLTSAKKSLVDNHSNSLMRKLSKIVADDFI